MATDRPSQVAMVTTVPSSSSPSKVVRRAMNINSSQSSRIDGGQRSRLRLRLRLLLALQLLILRRGLRRPLLLLMMLFLMLLLSLLEFDRDGAAATAGAGAGGSGPRRLAATVMVSSDEHEHMLEASSSRRRSPQLSAVADGNIILLLSGFICQFSFLQPSIYGTSCESEGGDRNLVGTCSHINGLNYLCSM